MVHRTRCACDKMVLQSHIVNIRHPWIFEILVVILQVVFERFDRDRSGSIDKGEMGEALLSLGYVISPQVVDCLLQKYDRTGQARAMDYDSFVEYGCLDLIFL